MLESVVRTSVFPALKIMRSAVQKPVYSAFIEHFGVSVSRFGKRRISIRKEQKHRRAAVGSSRSPVRPFVVAIPETVIPTAVGEHEIEMSADYFYQPPFQLLVADLKRVFYERGNGLFDVIAYVHRFAALCRRLIVRFALAVQQTVFRYMLHGVSD